MILSSEEAIKPKQRHCKLSNCAGGGRFQRKNETKTHVFMLLIILTCSISVLSINQRILL